MFTTASDRVLGEENGCLGKCSVKITISTLLGFCQPLQGFDMISDGRSASRMLSPNEYCSLLKKYMHKITVCSELMRERCKADMLTKMLSP